MRAIGLCSLIILRLKGLFFVDMVILMARYQVNQCTTLRMLLSAHVSFIILHFYFPTQGQKDDKYVVLVVDRFGGKSEFMIYTAGT